jgi:hypothetical protein
MSWKLQPASLPVDGNQQHSLGLHLDGTCRRARNSSVEQDVLYFVFPNSAFAASELNLEAVNTKVKERAFGLYNKLRGASLRTRVESGRPRKPRQICAATFSRPMMRARVRTSCF